MKLLVIGATQGIGLEVVKQGLNAGHEVSVLVRSPQKIEIKHPNLTVIKGDALDEKSVNQALMGQDVVIYTVGVPPSRQPIVVFSQSTQVLLKAMQTQGVSRALIVTGLGAGDSKGHGGFFYDKLLQPLLLKTIYEDKDRQEAIVKSSSLDWTLVRPGFLSNGKHKGTYRVSENLTGIKAGKISRSDVAGFLLEEAMVPKYIRKTILLD